MNKLLTTIHFLSFNPNGFFGILDKKKVNVRNDSINVYDIPNRLTVLAVISKLSPRKLRKMCDKFTYDSCHFDYSAFFKKEGMIQVYVIECESQTEIQELNYAKLRSFAEKSRSMWMMSRYAFKRLKQNQYFKIIDMPSITVTY